MTVQNILSSLRTNMAGRPSRTPSAPAGPAVNNPNRIILPPVNAVRQAAPVQPVALTPPRTPVPATPGSTILQQLNGGFPIDYMTSLIDGVDRNPEVSRLASSELIHASALIDACSRQEVLARLYGKGSPIYKSVSGSDRLVWALGRAVEKHVRNQFLEAVDRNAVYGVWKCRRCDESYTGLYDRARRCSCNRTMLDYGEPPLFNTDIGVVGNPDISFLLNGRMTVAEIKSMEKEAFALLDAPLGNHVHQAILYRALYELAGYPVNDIVIIFYASKGYSFKFRDKLGRHPIYREFHVDATQPHLRRLVNQSFELAREVKAALIEGHPPPRSRCTQPTDAKAKDCPMASICFNLPG